MIGRIVIKVHNQHTHCAGGWKKLSGVMIPEGTPLKYETISGIYRTNRVAVKKLDEVKIGLHKASARQKTGVEGLLAQIMIPQLVCDENEP